MSVGLSFGCCCWCMTYQFLQYFQWRGQVVYKVLHAARVLIELQPWHLCYSRRGFFTTNGCWWSTVCARQAYGTETWLPEVGRQTAGTACNRQREPHRRACSRSGMALKQGLVAAPRSLLCLFPIGKHLLDINPQFNNAELLIPPRGTTTERTAALAGTVIKISTPGKRHCLWG